MNGPGLQSTRMSRLRIEDAASAHVQPMSLELHAGECIGLSGPSGMGKSLFLRIIADLDPHQGQIWLDGHEQQTIPATEWRSKVALLASESGWWAETVGEHFADMDASTLQQLGFSNDCLDWEVERLSSGEKQRLALLRLLAMQPEVLLLDEPTANLDPESVRKVEALIANYRKQNGAAVIWVSHDREQVKRVASRQYRLTRDGLFEEKG
jgi:ABC-type iron transport system FetAB ATPase subunit